MPKVVDRDAMRRTILEAAMRVFMRSGYHASTIAEVAEAAGLGKGTLYLYFKNKEALVEAMVDAHFSAMEARSLAQPRPESLADFLKQVGATLYISPQEAAFVRVFFEVFGPSFASDAFTVRVAGFFDRLGDHFASAIAHLRKQGHVRADLDPKAAGRALVAMADGLILHRGLFSLSDARYLAMRKETLALFLRGMAP